MDTYDQVEKSRRVEMAMEKFGIAWAKQAYPDYFQDIDTQTKKETIPELLFYAFPNILINKATDNIIKAHIHGVKRAWEETQKDNYDYQIFENDNEVYYALGDLLKLRASSHEDLMDGMHEFFQKCVLSGIHDMDDLSKRVGLGNGEELRDIFLVFINKDLQQYIPDPQRVISPSQSLRVAGRKNQL